MPTPVVARPVGPVGIVAIVDAPGLDGGVVRALEDLCAVACRRLAVLGVSVTLMSEEAAYVAAASSSSIRQLDEAQFALGEGPSRDAHRTRRLVLADLHDTGVYRWPAYTDAALDAGVRGIGAFPLQVGASRLGVLTVYSATMLDPDQLGTVLSYVDVADDLLVDGSLDAENGHLAEDLDTALGATLDTHAHIYQAQGMVMVDLQISLAEALARMRAHAWSTGSELHVLAAEIVAGRTRLARDEPR